MNLPIYLAVPFIFLIPFIFCHFPHPARPLQNKRSRQSSSIALSFDKLYSFLDPRNTTILWVEYTNRASAVNDYIEKIQPLLEEADEKIVGLDVEYTNEQSSMLKAVVVQLCVGTDCLVYQIFQADKPCSKLADFFVDPNISFAGINGIRPRRSLVPVTNFVDIHKRWKPVGSTNAKDSLANYVVSLIDSRYKAMKETKKDVDHKKWENMPLTEEQIQYGSFDTYVTYEVYRWIVNFERCQQTLEMFNKKKQVKKKGKDKHN